MSKQLRQEIGERLQIVRERAHISTGEAAQAAGVQPLAVEKWERGCALPPLLEFRALLPLYGVMAWEVLFDGGGPIELSSDQAAELQKAAIQFSPGLRARMDCILAIAARAREPKWKSAALGDAPGL